MDTAYCFDAETGEYIGAEPIYPDPMTGELIPPANATKNAPPKLRDGQVPVWSGDAWEVKTDHRGKEYWLADGSFHTITEIDETMPNDALNEKPPLPVHTTAEMATAAAYGWIENLVHAEIDGGKPLSEITTYPQRATAARAVVAGTATDDDKAVLLRLLVASGRNATAAAEAMPALAAEIKAKADARDTALAFTTAMRQQVEAQIAAADVEADPFTFDKILAQAAKTAQAKWVELSSER